MTGRQVDLALALYVAGKTYTEIADKVDIDPSRVGQLARKAGLPYRGEKKCSQKLAAWEVRQRNIAERRSSQTEKA